MILEIISVCPICSGQSFKPFLVTRDYTVSQNDFSLQQCENCKFILTNPRPDQASISQFYQSDKYISHTGGSRSLLDQIYLQARKFTLRSKFNLIKKYSASIGQLKTAHLILYCPCKCPFFMSKQFTFKEVSRNSGTV